MTAGPANNPAMFSVFLKDRCLGFILTRGGLFEAVDASEKSIGHFETAKEAASAIVAQSIPESA